MSYPALLKAWLIILAAMIANGMVREEVLRAMVGPRAAEILSAAFGIAIVTGLTRLLLRRIAGRSPAEMVRASVFLVVLTVLFDLLFGRYVQGRSWADVVGEYAVWRGRPWPFVLGALAFTPFLWGRWALREPRHAR